MDSTTLTTLPDDPEILKGIIGKLTREQERFCQEIELLREQIHLLIAKRFGPSSEKTAPRDNPQLPLFDLPEPAEIEPAPEIVEVPAHSRRKRGRKPLPASLPRIEVVHDIDEAQKQCGCGASLSRIGEEVAEKLDIIPATIRVIRHIRPKYACKHCEGLDTDGATVKIAPTPPQIIPKGIVTAGLLAHVLVGKFCDALPFYRQEKQFARLGVALGRATMCSWAMKAAEACRPVVELLHHEIRSGPLINIDETSVQVLAEPGRAATTKSYMWVCRGGPPDKPGIRYHYAPSRSKAVAKQLLTEYTGVVQTDGYNGYDFLDTQEGVIHAGCLAHVRRTFDEIRKARGKKHHKTGSADVALNWIKQLYRIESEAKRQELTGDELLAERRGKAKPILDDFHEWLREKATRAVPKSLLGKAVNYALGQWDRLVVYLDHAEMSPDNNLVENAIRPFVVGRKNWLFSGTPEGAQASADLYSLIESAKANGLEPYRYLRYLFEKLPFAQSPEDYRALLPMQLKPEQLRLDYDATGV
jgi:transposase